MYDLSTRGKICRKIVLLGTTAFAGLTLIILSFQVRAAKFYSAGHKFETHELGFINFIVMIIVNLFTVGYLNLSKRS